MRTISLRTLVRQPVKVKSWTRRGAKVRVTDNGRPLWVIQAAEAPRNDANRRHAMEEILDEVRQESPSTVSLSRIVKESRR